MRKVTSLVVPYWLVFSFAAVFPLAALDKCKDTRLDKPKEISSDDCDPLIAAFFGVDRDAERWCQTEVCGVKDCTLGKCNRASPEHLVGVCCKNNGDCRDESNTRGKCVEELGFIGCKQGESTKKRLCNAGEPKYVDTQISCTSVADRGCDGGRRYTCTAKIEECRCACATVIIE